MSTWRVARFKSNKQGRVGLLKLESKFKISD